MKPGMNFHCGRNDNYGKVQLSYNDRESHLDLPYSTWALMNNTLDKYFVNVT